MNESNLENLVEQRRNEKLQTILQNADDASKVVDDSGMTLLHLATKHNHLQLLKYLLHLRLDVNAKTPFKSTPLATAVCYNQFEAMKILLQSDADIFGSDCKGRSTMTILMSEINKFPDDVVVQIIENYQRSKIDCKTKAKILINAVCSFQFILSVADPVATTMFMERHDKLEVVEFNSAIAFAMQRQDDDNVRIILEYIKLKNMRNNEFFLQMKRFFSSGSGRNLESGELFLKRSMDWNIINKQSIKYYEILILLADKEAIKILLDSNIDEYIRKKFNIELLISLFSKSEVDVIELLKSRPFLVNGKCNSGSSALHAAARGSSEKILKFLLDMGADPNIQDNFGITPLLENITSGENNYGELLLQYGAKVQLDSQEDTIIENIYKSNPCYNGFVDTVIAQLAINNARGLEIEKRLRDDIQSNYMKKFEQCSEQMKELQKHELFGSVTLFTVLTVKPDEIAHHLRDKDYSLKLEDFCGKQQIHKFYYLMLKFKLDRVLKIYFSKSSFAEIVSQNTGIRVPVDHLVIEKVFSFLTFYDILQLL